MPKGIKGSRPNCSIEGCNQPAKAHGYCFKHYKRWCKWGDPNFVKKTRDDKPETIRRATERILKYSNSPESRAYKSKHLQEWINKGITKEQRRKSAIRMHKINYKKKNKIVNDRTFFTSFIKRHCPEIDTSDDIPVTVYRELIDFFHPELGPTLEREWKMYLDD